MAFVALACTSGPDCEMRFGQFMNADRVVITSNMHQPLRTMTDTLAIRELASFALEHQSHWTAPWYGTPVALVRANFYHGAKFLGDLGLGSNFLEAQGCGDFQSRSLSPADRSEAMTLFGVQDPYATKAN